MEFPMKYRTLGRTELRVSVMGVGTGGPSNFGQSTGVPEEESARLVSRALDLGINFFDTSAAYRESESILGRALDGVRRDE
jgi:aryl-alcohol dehydrogenase-like predicted oxidoreductase